MAASSLSLNSRGFKQASVDTLKVRDARDVEEVVRAAIAGEQPLEIIGHGSKRLIGQPMATNALLDLSALNAVTSYEPNELIITVQAGAPLADVRSLIDSKNQQFAFEPMDTAPLLGTPNLGTIGGMIGAGLAGPRSIKAGGARDHLLGAHGVSGFGDSFKAGGRVVKNVTGYDLPRLLCGAFGTLAVVTEITLKVLPRPPHEETVLVAGLSPERAAKAMSAAMGSPCEVSGAAYLPAEVAGRIPGLGGAADAAMFRLEGVVPSVRARREMLLKTLVPFGAGAVIEEQASLALWRAVRDAAPFWGTGERALWRISTRPTAGPLLGAELSRTLGAQTYCDWAGGLVWAQLPGALSHAEAVRAALAPHGGHATLIRADAAERARVPVFQPEERALAALAGRVKKSFDPARVLNPGRMHAGV